MLSGRIWKFGDDINTDLIQPTPYMYLSAEQQARYVFQANRPGWAEQVRAGDIIVAGERFGMGSSRPAPLALRALGIGCLLANSVNGLFFRNCVSFGLLALECPGVSQAFEEGDIANVDADGFEVHNATQGRSLACVAVPRDLVALMREGGIFPLLESEGLIGPGKQSTAGPGRAA